MERSQRLTGRVWVAVNWCSEFLIVISFIELYELSRRILCHFSVSYKSINLLMYLKTTLGCKIEASFLKILMMFSDHYDQLG